MMNTAIVHLFYPELVDEIIQFIELLPVQNVIFTTCDESIFHKIDKINNPNWQISIVENKGMDIGPFLLSLDKVSEDCDYIYKIHTKKDAEWRKDLLNGLLQDSGDRPLFGSNKWYYTDPIHYNKDKIFKLCDMININYPNKKFIAGTIFAIKKDLLFKYIFEYRKIIYDLLEEGVFNDRVESKYTHSMERILGSLCYLEKYSLTNIIFPDNFNGKILFLPINRVASENIGKFLKLHFSNQLEIFSKGDSISDFNDYFKLTFVRNPHSRLTSYYRAKSDNLDDFDYWFNEKFTIDELPLQNHFIDKMNFIGRYENIEDDLNTLLEFFQIENSTNFDYDNQSIKKPIKMSIESRNKILEIYSDDFEKLNY